jgi:hypothetical protein
VGNIPRFTFTQILEGSIGYLGHLGGEYSADWEIESGRKHMRIDMSSFRFNDYGHAKQSLTCHETETSMEKTERESVYRNQERKPGHPLLMPLD